MSLRPAILLAALACPLPAHALTSASVPDLEEVARTAELLVAARVTATHSSWNEDGSLLFTEVTAIPLRHWKGSGHDPIRFRLVGGETDRVGLLVPGTPRAEVGADYLLALSPGIDRVLAPVRPSECVWRLAGGAIVGLDLRLDDVAAVLEGRRARSQAAAATCVPALVTASGSPLRWASAATRSGSMLINPNPPAGFGSSEWGDLVRSAAAAWNAVSLGFCFRDGGTTPLTGAGRQPDGSSVIHAGDARGALASTTVWYEPSTGVILEADLVVDAGKRFSREAAAAGLERYDLAATLTHELGHVLGLADAEPSIDAAVMSPVASPAGGAPRPLAGADACGVEALYGGRDRQCPPLAGTAPPVLAARGPGPVPGISELMNAGSGAIRFSLQRAGKVSAGVYDLAGRLVYSFPTLYLEPGAHTLRWGGRVGDTDGAAHGLYFVRLRLGDGAPVSQKVVWTK